MFEIVNTDVLTYDNAEEVKAMAREHGFQMRLIPMTNTHHATMEELVIGKELSWMDQYPAVHEPQAEYKTNKISKSISTHTRQPRRRRAADMQRKKI